MADIDWEKLGTSLIDGASKAVVNPEVWGTALSAGLGYLGEKEKADAISSKNAMLQNQFNAGEQYKGQVNDAWTSGFAMAQKKKKPQAGILGTPMQAGLTTTVGV